MYVLYKTFQNFINPLTKYNHRDSIAKIWNKSENVYIYVGLESGLRRWAFNGFSLELAIVVIQRRVY